MRDRAWRRYKEEVKLLQRLHRICRTSGWGHQDENGLYYINPSIKHFIGSYEYKMFKTHTTKYHDTRFKTKYSPNHLRAYWRDENKNGKRETDKVLFLKILKEYGIR
jgi:hypothetical protein